jgi:hypothetical protein
VTTQGRRTGTAVDDAMADAEHASTAVATAEPSASTRARPAVAHARIERLVRDLRAVPSFAVSRGEVPMPSICPRASSRQPASSGRT